MRLLFAQLVAAVIDLDTVFPSLKAIAKELLGLVFNGSRKDAGVFPIIPADSTELLPRRFQVHRRISEISRFVVAAILEVVLVKEKGVLVRHFSLPAGRINLSVV